jgi:hypothetical protein
MPKAAAEAWMHLDSALFKLQRTREQLAVHDRAQLMQKVQQAIEHVEAAMKEIQ